MVNCYLFVTLEKKKRAWRNRKNTSSYIFEGKSRVIQMTCCASVWGEQNSINISTEEKLRRRILYSTNSWTEFKAAILVFIFIIPLTYTIFRDFCYFTQSFMLRAFHYAWKWTERKQYKCIKIVLSWVQFYLSFSFHSLFCSLLLCSPCIRANFTV